MDYQIVHAVEGRIRIRIPLLAEEAEYASKLQKRVESLNYVTNVRINPLAESMIVTYKYKFVSCTVMQTHLQEAIAQVASPKSPSASDVSEPKIAQVASPQSPSTPPASEPVVIEKKSPSVSTGVAQELFAYSVEQVNPDKDPWEEEATPAIEAPSDQFQADLSTPEVSAIEDDQAKDKLVDTVTQQVNSDVIPLQTSALAKRLEVHPKALSRYKSKPDFSQWSQKKDPNSIAWTYDSVSKIFCPTELTVSTEQSNLQEQRMQTEVEKVGSEVLGGIVGGIVGETVGGVIAGPIGMVVGEQVGTVIGPILGEDLGKQAEHVNHPEAQKHPELETQEQIEVSASETIGGKIGETVGEIVGEVLLGQEGGVIGKNMGEKIGSAVTEILEKEVIVNSESGEQESDQN
ncbi:HMA2 domain-containing protein [Nostoc sp. UHCC 0302]|uniref:HMA2 domain-containing protein n=1 Tax=Nostoc sp. UHCC 0302 TaxID=3134896 RepID=UPI00311C99B9